MRRFAVWVLVLGLLSAPPARAQVADPLCPADLVAEVAFRDIATSVHADAISCLQAWNVVHGQPDGRYEPEANLTRAQLATVMSNLLRAAGVALPAASERFTDDDGSTHEGNIDALAAKGVMLGVGGTKFAPNRVVTRAQLASTLVRAYTAVTGRLLQAAGDHFADDDGSVHESSINAAYEAGLVLGLAVDDARPSYGPGSTLTRGQFASFGVRLVDLLVEGGFAQPPTGPPVVAPSDDGDGGAPALVNVTLDRARRVTQVVGATGGTITLTAADGTTFALTVPGGALEQSTAISMTPVLSLEGLPLTGGLGAAVHLEPSGLAFAVPAALTMTFTSPPGDTLAGFTYSGDADSYTIVLSTPGAMTFTVPVAHFSGGGAAAAVPSDFDAIVVPLIQSAGSMTFAQVGELLELIAEWERIFGAGFCEGSTSCRLVMRKAHDALAEIGDAACAAGQGSVATASQLEAVYRSIKQVTDAEVLWDALRLLDVNLGTDAVAPDSIPLTGQTVDECREATLGRVIGRAIELAQLRPFGRSAVATPANASPAEEVANIGWLIDLAGQAALLTLQDLVDQATWAADDIGSALATGALDRAESDPFVAAPAEAQEPYVLAHGNYDGGPVVNNLEWAYFLSVQLQALTIDAGTDLISGISTALDNIIERGLERCLTDLEGGRGDLNQGRNFVTSVDFLSQTYPSLFNAAVAACPVKVTVSPASTTVAPGENVQFSATVTGTTDTAVTWSSPDASTPTTSGAFSAPTTPGTYHVVATSVAHPLRSATAVVTVQGDLDAVRVFVPNAATLGLGQTFDFGATVIETTNGAVTWTSSGGTLTPLQVQVSGTSTTSYARYTAGGQPGTYEIVATSVANPTKSATVVITILDAQMGITPSRSLTNTTAGSETNLQASMTRSDGAGYVIPVTWAATMGAVTPHDFNVGRATWTAPYLPGATGSVTATSSTVSSLSASVNVSVSSRSLLTMTTGCSGYGANSTLGVIGGVDWSGPHGATYDVNIVSDLYEQRTEQSVAFIIYNGGSAEPGQTQDVGVYDATVDVTMTIDGYSETTMKSLTFTVGVNEAGDWPTFAVSGDCTYP